MRDPRAHEVAEPGPPTWARGDMAPAPDWRPGGKGLPPLAWATQFCLQRKLPFSYFDIGANVGLEGLAEATLHARCGCSFPVHLFEPSPLSSLIERSVGANGVADVASVHRMALSDADGSAIFHFYPHASGGSSLMEEKAALSAGVRDVVSTVVETIRLDTFLSRHGILDDTLIVKIDTEGNDFRVISGMRDAIAERHVVIQFEFLPGLIGSYADPVSYIRDLLRSHILVDVTEPGRHVLLGLLTVEAFVAGALATGQAYDVLAVPRTMPESATLLERVLLG